jgi:hypothetical protein
LKNYIDPKVWSRAYEVILNATKKQLIAGQSSGTVETSGVGYAIDGKKVGFERLDKSVTDMLEKKYPNVTNMTYVKDGDRYYVYMGNRWEKATVK